MKLISYVSMSVFKDHFNALIKQSTKATIDRLQKKLVISRRNEEAVFIARITSMIDYFVG